MKELLGVVAFILFILICFRMYAHGIAYEWMSDHRNVDRLKRHYLSEGINTFVNYPDRSVGVCFYHKGKSYHQSISFVQAMAHMEKTPNGDIRKRLIKYLK